MTDPKSIIRRLRNSSVPWERTAIYAGRVLHDGSPFLIPLKSIREHGAFVGPNGSGKTTAMRKVMRQTGEMDFPHSRLVPDGKADTAELRAEAHRNFERKRWLTIRTGKSTYVFNPFDQTWYRALGEQERVDYWMGALNLSYGTEYGKSHFTDANAAMLMEALAQNPTSLQEFGEAVQVALRAPGKGGGLPQETKSAGVHVINILRRLSRLKSLSGPSTIQLSEFYTTPISLYIDASMTLGSEINRYHAHLVTYALPAAAASVPVEKRIPILVYKDEAARFLGRNTALLLMQLRSMGASMLLGYQSALDAKAQLSEIASAIESNAGMEWTFGATTPQEIKRLMDLSGHVVETERSASSFVPRNREKNTFAMIRRWAGRGEYLIHKEVILPRLNVNEIAAMTSHPLHSILRVREGNHLGLPVMVEHFRHQLPSEFQKDMALPWPEPNADTVINTDEPPPSAPVTIAPVPPMNPPKDNVARPRKRPR
jgi:hypothetical protein